MRRILLLVMLFLAVPVFAQEEETDRADVRSNFALGLMGDEYGGVYFMYESFVDKITLMNNNSSIYTRVASYWADANVYEDFQKYNIEAKSSYSASLGVRSYFSKRKMGRGFYLANEFKYSYTKFNDSRLKGTYSYISFVNPELGYKLGLGKSKRFSFEIFLGAEWAIEIAGKGDIDNKDFDNWKPKFGLGVGYAF